MNTVADPVFSFPNFSGPVPVQVPITICMATTLMQNTGNAPLTERRRRSRIVGETLGWIVPPKKPLALHLPDEEESWEVRIYNVSRLGVNFCTTEPLPLGSQHRLRIGRGPIRRARTIRVIFCRKLDASSFSIGAEFVDASNRGMSRAA